MERKFLPGGFAGKKISLILCFPLPYHGDQQYLLSHAKCENDCHLVCGSSKGFLIYAETQPEHHSQEEIEIGGRRNEILSGCCGRTQRETWYDPGAVTAIFPERLDTA